MKFNKLFLSTVLFLSVLLSACGARTGLEIGEWSPEVIVDPSGTGGASQCSEPFPAPPCVDCRNSACEEQKKEFDFYPYAMQIQLCAQQKCYGIPFKPEQTDPPSEGLNACIRSCDSNPQGDPSEAWVAFLNYTICGQWDTNKCEKTACKPEDDYQMCRDSLGSCASEEEIANKCMLLFWLEHENDLDWGL